MRCFAVTYRRVQGRVLAGFVWMPLSDAYYSLADSSIIEATKLFGVSRATLYRKLEQYTIERE